MIVREHVDESPDGIAVQRLLTADDVAAILDVPRSLVYALA
jgi:hypothetical protein